MDFKRHTITINRQLCNDSKKTVDLDLLKVNKTKRERITKPPKGNPEYSIREIPLTSIAERIIKEAYVKNPSGEYLFMEYGRPLNGDTFNDWLRRYSTDADVPYLSSHKLRFTVACHLYDGGKGISPKVIQRIMGHSNLDMTLHYLQAYDGEDITIYRKEMEGRLNYQII